MNTSAAIADPPLRQYPSLVVRETYLGSEFGRFTSCSVQAISSLDGAQDPELADG